MKSTLLPLALSLGFTGVLTACHRLPLDTQTTPTADQQNTTQEPKSIRESTYVNKPNDDNPPDELDELDELDALELLDSEPEDRSADNVEPVPWTERSFAGNTRYTIETSQSGETIKGETDGQASVLYRQIRVDLTQTARVSWQWKIEHVYTVDNERTRAGDDFPARFYVVVQTGNLPWQTKTINYVWASREPEQTHWLNPFTDDALMLVLDSGSSRAGQWVTQQRDLIADFKRYWQLDVTELSGYAFMVDGDNTGSQGVAWFRNLRFSPQ